jgi:HK97 family phage major capsid protein
VRTFTDINVERDRLRSRKSDLFTQAEAIASRDDPSPGQLERASRLAQGIEKLNAELDELDGEYRDVMRTMVDDPTRLEMADEGTTRDAAPPVGHFTSRSQLESRALRAVDRLLDGSAADRLDGVIRDKAGDPWGVGARYLSAVSSPLYLSAFGQLLADPQTAHLSMSPAELASVREVRQADAMRAMSLAAGSGGYAVPFSLDPSIIGTSNGVTNPIREISRVISIATDEWRGISSGAITSSYAAEATETTDNAPTLAQPVISTEKAQAFIPFSIEIGMDWPSLQQELGKLLAESKDALEAAKFLSGTGADEPFGLLVGITNTVAAAAGADAFTASNIYSLAEALPPRYQANSKFLASMAIINRIYRLTPSGSTTEPQLMDLSRGSLLGRPIYEMSTMPTAATTGLKFLVVGDFSRFAIVDRIGLQVELIPHIFGTGHKPTGQRGLYAFWRNSSKVLDAGAFRALLGTA